MKKGDKAVSEIIGAIFLLAMAISVFSIIYINVLGDNGPAPDTFVTITGKLETNDYVPNTVVFENYHGETLGLDTKILLYINGTLYENGLTIKDLISRYPRLPQLYLNDGWDVGEKLYPVDPKLILEDVPIYANIIDKESNSIVFWGILQIGNITKMGGIWHFNEPYWDGTPKEVKDSSGNGNHGTAYSNADTTYDETVSIGADSSGHFNYPSNDKVNVPNNHSLNIRNNITIEAWIKPESYDLSGYLELKEKFGYNPYIIKNNNSEYIYTVVSRDKNNVGKIQTFYISNLNSYNLTYREFGNSSGKPDETMTPVVTHISNDIYVVAYNDWLGGNSQYLSLQRFNINSDGVINFVGNLIRDDNDSRMGNINRPSIIRISDEVFAVVYNIIKNDKTELGIIRTVKIFSDGTWKFIDYNYFETDSQGYEPSIINIDGDIYAIAYRGSSDNIVIKTYRFDSNDGAIKYISEKTWFDTNGYEPSILRVSGVTFAVAYRLPSNDGYIKTFKIYKDGTIDSKVIDDNIFSGLEFFNPNIICLSEKHFVITYAPDSKSSSGNVGYYILLRIENNGLIFNIEPPEKIIIEEKPFLSPVCVTISDRAFAVVYTTQTHGGRLKIITPKYSTDTTDTGVVCKEGSYGIYANTTKLVVHIANETKTAKIETSIDPSNWHNIILTYDTTKMELYIDGNLIDTKPLNGVINISNNDLKFGYLYQGYIDEIAIFDYVISSDDIINHSNPDIGIWSFY